ncbi:hypothetical protein ABPG74_009403, partial [Tetrahymena malaccensis]
MNQSFINQFLIALFILINSLNCQEKVDTICDQYLEDIFLQKKFQFQCDKESNQIILDGNYEQNIEFSLEIQNYSTKTSIIFLNFKEIIIKRITFDKFAYSSDSNGQFLQIYMNKKVQVQEIEIQIESDKNTNLIQFIQNSNLSINSIKIIALNGFLSQSENVEKQIISIENLKNTIVQNYIFIYSQEKELISIVTLIGLRIYTQCTIKNLQIKIDFKQFFTKNQIVKLLRPIQYQSSENQLLQQKIGQILIELKSFLSLQLYLRNIVLFDITNINLNIENLNITSKNLLGQVFFCFNFYSVKIQNLHLQNSLIEENIQYNNYQEPYNMIQIPQGNSFNIENLIVQNCIFRQQYLLIYSVTYEENQIQLIINNFSIKDSYIVNSLIYIQNEFGINELVKINFKSENTDYEGINSFMFIQNSILILSIQMITNNIVKTQNGLFQFMNQQELNLFNSSVIINEQSLVQLGPGGILQIFQCNHLNITDLNAIQLSQTSIQGQFGGIFQMKGIIQLNLNSVQARSIKFQGQGGFAYIEAIQVQIENSDFKDFYSKGSGGTVFITCSQINMSNVIITNSQSQQLGGAIYFQILQAAGMCYFQNVKIQNSQAFIGGGVIINTSAQELIGVAFENNKSVFYDDNIFFPISSINIIGIGEYNPQLGDEFELIPKEFKQQNFYNQIQINLNDVNINQVYYVELELVFTDDKILRYEDLRKINIKFNQDFNLNFIQNSFNQNIQSLIFQVQEIQYDIVFLTFYYQSHQINSFRLINNLSFNKTNHFYFLFSVEQYFQQSINQQLILYGNYMNLYLQKQQESQSGQIKIENNQIKYFKYCNNLQVSLNKNQTKCSKCPPQQFESCFANITKLKKGYYMPINSFNYTKNNSDFQIQAIKCSFLPQNCNGGTKFDDSQCYQSHVGPLCLECDRKKTRSDILYTRSNSFSCSQCQNFKQNLILTVISIFSGIFLVAILDLLLFLCFKSIQKNKDIKVRISAGVHFKYSLFLMQIISICSFFSSPSSVSYFFTFTLYVWTPISSGIFNFYECFLIQLNLDFFSIPYLVMIIQSVIPIFFIIAYISIKWATIKIFQIQKKQKMLNNQKNKNQNLMLKESFLQGQGQANQDEIAPNKLINQQGVNQTIFLQSTLEQNDETIIHQQNLKINRENDIQDIQIENKAADNFQQKNQEEIKKQSFFKKYISDRSFTFQLIIYSIYSFNLQIVQVLVNGLVCAEFENIGSFSNLDLTIKCDDPERLKIVYFVNIPIEKLFYVYLEQLFYCAIPLKQSMKIIIILVINLQQLAQSYFLEFFKLPLFLQPSCLLSQNIQYYKEYTTNVKKE